MFGRLSGKRHFRAHSCHSLGTWILPQRVQWWGAGRGRYAFYLKMASCERTWCETKTGCSDILLLAHSLLSRSPRHHSSPSIVPTKLMKLFFFLCFYFLPCISSALLFSKAPSHSVLGLNVNKQSSLCSERTPIPLPKGMLLPILPLTMVTGNLLGITFYTEVNVGTRFQRLKCAFLNSTFTQINIVLR